VTEEPLSWKGHERRRYLRVPQELDVAHRPAESNAEPTEGRSADISIGGLLLITNAEMAVGTEVELLVSSPTHRIRQPLRGVVLRSVRSEKENRYYVGVEFASILPADDAEISFVLPPLLRGLAGKQNREFVRMTCRLPVEFKRSWWTPWRKAETRDLSLGGVMFASAVKVWKDTAVSLRIHVSDGACVRARARVVGAAEDPAGEGYLVSAAFEDLIPDAAEALAHYISQELRSRAQQPR
jgi:c-di-GMP-binding flagellar brake protein YcgR